MLIDNFSFLSLTRKQETLIKHTQLPFMWEEKEKEELPQSNKFIWYPTRYIQEVLSRKLAESFHNRWRPLLKGRIKTRRTSGTAL